LRAAGRSSAAPPAPVPPLAPLLRIVRGRVDLGLCVDILSIAEKKEPSPPVL
jgi:hypothetical protein